MSKKCNGYFSICKYKGTPTIVTLSDGDKEMERLCIDCCKEYLKQHPKLPEEIKAKMKTAIALNNLTKEQLEGLVKK